MDDASGAVEGPHALSGEERAALLAWAEEDPPEGFADAVLAAWVAAREPEPESEPAAAPEPRRARRASSLRSVIGIGTAISAAAVVMLLVRVPPSSGEGLDGAAGSLPSAQGCQAHAAAFAEPALAPSIPSVGPDAHSVLGAEAVAVLVHHCTPCHDGTDPDAKPGALGVFDVQQPRWWSTMSDAQLAEARLRIEELGDAADEERRRMTAFVDAELAQREHAG
ncbi:MAG: hypothetical protein KDK70_21035 [Myxococcales bacterium]|nr:hypothetical protein [Myxococcales bacterium]